MQHVAHAKRKCNLCHTYRFFKKSEEEKRACWESLNLAYDAFLQEFDEMRERDADEEELMRWRDNKRVVLDALDTCRLCDKEEPKAKTLLTNLR